MRLRRGAPRSCRRAVRSVRAAADGSRSYIASMDDWRARLEAASASTRALIGAILVSGGAGRPMFVDFTATWCKPCKKCDRATCPVSHLTQNRALVRPARCQV